MYLQGGLGNQLFQLAAGLEVANRLRVDLVLDCSRLGDPESALRKFALDPFNLPENVRVVRKPSTLEAWSNRRIVNRLKNNFNRRHFIENAEGYDKSIELVKPGFTLDGYFQSTRYFASAKPQVLELIRSCHLNPKELESVEALSREPFIAVHIRRGDYTNPEVAAVHGLAGRAYFKEAIAHLEKSTSLGRILYFSDSPKIVQVELDLMPQDFAPNDLSEVATLLLMSRATHLIASNSTFSWWAGLVCDSTNSGSVIVPKPWFAETTPPDLLPTHWLQIANS